MTSDPSIQAGTTDAVEDGASAGFGPIYVSLHDANTWAEQIPPFRGGSENKSFDHGFEPPQINAFRVPIRGYSLRLGAETSLHGRTIDLAQPMFEPASEDLVTMQLESILLNIDRKYGSMLARLAE